jgi:NAD dependent epimerase/dehydratase family enzyme
LCRQDVFWIHEQDFARAVRFLLDRADIDGPVTIAAPNPLLHKEFMRTMRAACGAPAGLPASRWMAELGAFALRTDTELLLKSRRVVPGRLQEAGFEFDFEQWLEAAFDLVARN